MAKNPHPLRNEPSIETVDQFLDTQEAALTESFQELSSNLLRIHSSLRQEIQNVRKRIHGATVLAAELNTTFITAAQQIQRSLDEQAQSEQQEVTQQ